MIVRELVTLLSFTTRTDGMKPFDDAVSRIEGRVRTMSTAIGTAAGMMVTQAINSLSAAMGNAGQYFVQSGDQMVQTGNRVRSAIDDLSEANGIIEAIYQDALQTGISMNDTANVFARFAPALRTAGFDNARALNFIGGLQRSMLVSGATVSEAASTVRQMGQAFNSGVLRGDEFNSMMENGGKLVRLFAQEMGVSVADLRKMAEDGLLTTARIGAPMERAVNRLRTEFASMELTVELASARFGIRARRVAADIMQAFGFTSFLVGRLQWVSEWLGRVGARIPELGRQFREFGGMARVIELFGYTVAAILGVLFIANMAAAERAIQRLGAAFLIAGAKIFAFGALIGTIVLALDDLAAWMRGDDSILGRRLGNFEEFMDGLRDRAREFAREMFGEGGAEAFNDIMRALGGLRIYLEGVVAFLTGDWSEAWRLAGVGVSEMLQTNTGLLIGFLATVWSIVAALRLAATLSALGGAVGGAGAAGAVGVAAGAAAGAGGAATGAGAAAAGAGAGAATGILARLVPLALRLGPIAAAAGAASALNDLPELNDTSAERQSRSRQNMRDRGRLGGFYATNPVETPEANIWAPENDSPLTRDQRPSLFSLQDMATPTPAPVPVTPSNVQTNNIEANSPVSITMTVTAPAPTAEEIAAAVRGEAATLSNTITEALAAQSRRLSNSVPRMEAPAQ